MIERSLTRKFHLAGVIPVAGQPLEFNMPWNDCLMPIAADYTAIERAVYECACAGCETIWIVLHKEAQVLIRERIGDWVEDPVWVYFMRNKYDWNPYDKKKEIPIYYVPIHPKDRDKRDCLAWSALYGVNRAYKAAASISQWVIPDKYYICFPYGVHSSYNIRKNYREKIHSHRFKNFYLRHNGETVADGRYLSFTMGTSEFIKYRRIIRGGTGYRVPGVPYGDGNNFTRLPSEEKYSARFFSLKDVFGKANIAKGEIADIWWHYDIDTWNGYSEYMGSQARKWQRRPKGILKYHEFNPIAKDNVFEEEVDEEEKEEEISQQMMEDFDDENL